MKKLYRTTENIDKTYIEIQEKTFEQHGTTTRTSFGEEIDFPTETECFDAYKEHEKVCNESSQPEFMDPNSWLMCYNWMKEILVGKK